MPRERVIEPCSMVIFGATGDLTRRKLVPALYNLARARLLPSGFAVVAVARRPFTGDAFRDDMRRAVDTFSRSRPVIADVWDDFAKGIFYHQGEFSDPGTYAGLRATLEDVDRERGTRGNHIFYLATPPDHYAEIIRHLGEAGLGGSARDPWTRIIVEKPFGHDLRSACALNRCAQEVFSEEQIYRIDHYLGKETVQNIVVMRFANGIFEPLWNQKYIDHVQITVAEDLGMEGRGAYYDRAGALRDMVQNHMMQLLSLTAMEPPVAFQAEPVRNEKVKVLQSVRPIEDEDVARHVVRAQYTAGFVGGREVRGYVQEKGVAPESGTETYVAIRLFIDNWRWAGVPFYLRTGKRLPKRVTEIAVQFRQAPHLLFQGADIQPNVLAMRIQPDEGISLKMTSKGPGAMVLQPVVMDFRYGSSFGAEPPEAYERLLLDCVAGDPTLFTRHDEVELAWQLMTGILDAWQGGAAAPHGSYPAGTWGPPEADEMVDRWRRL
jgi:glucose-6-phosphate 1-dehydrogenase